MLARDQAFAVRFPTPTAAYTDSSKASAAPASVARYQPASIMAPKISGDTAKPVSRPEYTVP